MTAEIRTAAPADLPSMIDLLVQDAGRRQAHDPGLWRIAGDARQKVADAVAFAIAAENQPFRQQWLVAEQGGKLVGLAHTLRLPVPPIYAGEWGDPGLLQPETFVTDDASEGTLGALIDAAEDDLRASGASLLLASVICGDELISALRQKGYEPLTLYLSKSALAPAPAPARHSVRLAKESDIDGIVTRSAENRSVLHDLNPFWKPHPDADARFGNWMKKSLALTDRDMLLSGPEGTVTGYAVAQPASRLHFPPAQDISATGFIDDYFHRQFADPFGTAEDGEAMALLLSAESALAARGIGTTLVVCPAAWASKIALLESMGYKTAMVWMIRR